MIWDEQQRQEQVDKVHALRRKRRTMYRRVFGSDDGKWILDDLMARGFVIRALDPSLGKLPEHELFKREGARCLVLDILKDVYDTKDLVATIQRKHEAGDLSHLT